MVYHIGIIRGTGKVRCWNNGHRHNTIVIQARRNIDFLSCDINEYMGERETSKAQLKQNAPAFLAWYNKRNGTNFKRAIVD